LEALCKTFWAAEPAYSRKGNYVRFCTVDVRTRTDSMAYIAYNTPKTCDFGNFSNGMPFDLPIHVE